MFSISPTNGHHVQLLLLVLPRTQLALGFPKDTRHWVLVQALPTVNTRNWRPYLVIAALQRMLQELQLHQHSSSLTHGLALWELPVALVHLFLVINQTRMRWSCSTTVLLTTQEAQLSQCPAKHEVPVLRTPTKPSQTLLTTKLKKLWLLLLTMVDLNLQPKTSLFFSPPYFNIYMHWEDHM